VFLQGIFRGLHDTTTPFWATLGANLINLSLLPPFIFSPLHWGVRGSAAATATAQSVPCLALLLVLQWRFKLRLRVGAVRWRQLGALFAPTGE
jgi:Na+-driven multidrug efflux pump